MNRKARVEFLGHLRRLFNKGSNVQRENTMPVAVVNDETRRFDLKSLAGGYVVIREMSYGERIYRANLSGAMKILKDQKSDYAGELAMETSRITLWDFMNLIVEHNLEDRDGRPLNLHTESDVKKLSSKIGEEIGTYIDEVNNFEVEAGN